MPQALGCLYVLEGATLGGRVVARHLAGVTGLAASPFAFFTSYGEEVGPMWRSFGEFLTERAAGADAAIIAAACATFATLEQWLREGVNGSS